MDHFGNEAQEVRSGLVFVDVDVDVLQVRGHVARVEDDRNVALNALEFPGEVYACFSPEQVIRDRAADGRFPENRDRLGDIRCEDDIEAVLFQDLLSQAEVTEIIIDTEDQWSGDGAATWRHRG